MSTRTSPRPWSATRRRGCNVRDHDGVGIAFTCISAGLSRQTYHIIVPFAAGGITDVIGRALGQRLAEAWGQQVVIENRPGGGIGQVGTESVARSAPDGYTLLVTADATFVTCLIPTASCRTTPSTTSCRSPASASARRRWSHPSLPVRTLGELVDYARKRPGELNSAEPSALDRADISTSFCWKA